MKGDFILNCNKMSASKAVMCSDRCAVQPGCMENAHKEHDKFPNAMAYVPMQKWEKIYDLREGLERGTIFPSLDLPFIGGALNE